MPTNPTVTLAQIKALSPCDHSWDRVSAALKTHGVKARQKITARDAADAGCTLDDLIWIASAVSRKDKDVERRLTLFLADCAAKVLHHFEREFPTDMRVRNCIIAQRQYARGEIDEAARAAWAASAASAARAAWAAWAASAASAARAAEAARAARAASAASAARAAEAARAASAASAARAARAAEAARAARAAEAASEKWQTERLILWLTDEPTDWPLPAIQQVKAA